MTLNGIDVASYQTGMNVGAVAGDFVIIKATGGTGYVNPYCNTHVEQALNAGKKLGLYHFAHEKGYQGSAEQEAQFFLDSIKNYIGKAMLVLDFESDNQYDVAWAKAWLDYVYNSTGVRPVIYLGLGTENSADWSSVINANYGLWVAQYNNYNAVNGYQPRDLYGSLRNWKSMAMFQYTSTGRLGGWGGNLDLDVFYGDASAWDAYASVTGKPTPQPTPKPAASNIPSGFTPENGTFVNGDTQIMNRVGAPSTSAQQGGYLPAYGEWPYDSWAKVGNYTWIHHVYNGQHIYLPVREWPSGTAWGTFK